MKIMILTAVGLALALRARKRLKTKINDSNSSNYYNRFGDPPRGDILENKEVEREARKEWLSLMNDRDGTTELVDRQR